MKKATKRVITYLLALVMMVSLMSALDMGTKVYAAEGVGNKVLIWSIDNATKINFISSSHLAPLMGVYEDQGVVLSDQTANTDHFVLGTDLSEYGLVWIYLPMTDLTDADITVLGNYLKIGGRIIMQAENTGYSETENGVLSRAATALGGGFTITSNVSYDQTALLNTNSKLINDSDSEVTTLKPQVVAEIDYEAPAKWIAKTGDGVAFIVDQAVQNGRLTILSDVDFYSSSNTNESAKNFIYNMYTDSMTNMTKVTNGLNPNTNFGDDEIFSLTYDGNGNTSGTVPASEMYAANGQVTVSENTGEMEKEGYFLYSWNTKADGSGTSYVPGAQFDIIENTTLYAYWMEIPDTYRVTYDGNGNTAGTVPTDTFEYPEGATTTVLDNTGSLAKDGYTFAGWNTKANGSGTSYAAGATFTISSNVTLYAQWNAVNGDNDGGGDNNGGGNNDGGNDGGGNNNGGNNTNVPKTGDNQMVAWLTLLAILSLGTSGLYFYKSRKIKA